MPIKVTLKHGLVAELLTAEDDRGPFVAPKVRADDHAETCDCLTCREVRETRERARNKVR